MGVLFHLGVWLVPLATLQKVCDALDVEPATKESFREDKTELERVERRLRRHCTAKDARMLLQTRVTLGVSSWAQWAKGIRGNQMTCRRLNVVSL